MFHRRFIAVALVIMAVVACTGAALGAQCAWTRLDVDGPPPRHSPGMAYDGEREVIVLFGGITGRTRGAQLFGDTWEWDGMSWKQIGTNGPQARARHGMVYEPRLKTFVAGGVAFGGRPDTILLDGTHWMQVPGVDGRSAAGNLRPSRVYYGMVYDAARERTLVFGGWDGEAPLGDTWEFRCDG